MEKAIKNKNSERIIIGILINNPDWIIEIGNLKHKHFFDRTHKTIFYIISLLVKENVETIDSLSILSRAEKIIDASSILESSGGYEYIEFIRQLSEEYTKEDLKQHTEMVVTCAYKREQQEQKEEFLKLLITRPDLDISDINQWLQEKQYQLQSEYSSGGDIALIGDVFDKTWANIVENRGKNGLVGLPSKIDIVNRYFTYRKSELVVIGARAKFGKSNFGINEAHNLAVLNKIPVAYLDSEMKTETFLARILAIDSGISITQIESGTFENDARDKLAVEQSMERIRKAPIIHKYSYHWDKASIRDSALLVQARYGVEMLIYDYIKVKEVGKSGQAKEHSELGNMTIFLKDLAGEMDIPILTFAQLSPHEIRLADSDKINRYASTIAYLLPKDPKYIALDSGTLGGTDYMYVDYNRNGASMNDPDRGINLAYTRHNVTFEQADYQVLDDDFQ